MSAERRAEHQHPVGDKLSVIFVGSHHVGKETFGLGTARKRAYDIVRLILFFLDHRYTIGFKYTLYIRYGCRYILRLLVAAGLIRLIHGMAERTPPGRIETNGYVIGIFLAQHLIERVAETENSRCVESVGCDTRRAQQSIIGAIYQRIRVK